MAIASSGVRWRRSLLAAKPGVSLPHGIETEPGYQPAATSDLPPGYAQACWGRLSPADWVPRAF